jgi:hypothetical protein
MCWRDRFVENHSRFRFNSDPGIVFVVKVLHFIVLEKLIKLLVPFIKNVWNLENWMVLGKIDCDLQRQRERSPLKYASRGELSKSDCDLRRPLEKWLRFAKITQKCVFELTPKSLGQSTTLYFIQTQHFFVILQWSNVYWLLLSWLKKGTFKF